MNQPKTLYIDNALVDKAVTHWRAGELVALPTETVYGLGADACSDVAVARIYAAKSRPQFNPLIVHVADITTAQRYVAWSDLAEILATAFWPGPLTLVLRRRADCPISDLVSAGGDTLAIRLPAHPVAQQLLAAFGGGIAAPSANRSGRVSPTTAAHVQEELGEAVALIVDGGACDVGLESTVLDISGDAPVILRPGSITREMLVERVSSLQSPVSSKKERKHVSVSVSASSLLETGDWRLETPLKSPGMLASHYAPSIPVRLNATEVAPDEALLAFGSAPLGGAASMRNLSSTGDLIEAAANLFSHLRALDSTNYRAIAVMPIPTEGIGAAINDRLRRAAV